MIERLREWFRAMHVLGPRWTVFVASMVGINAATLLLLFYFLRHWVPFKRPANDWVWENGPPLFWVLFGVMMVTSVGWALHMEHRLARWYCRGGPPTALELRTALTAPLQQSLLHLAGWALGAGVFIAVGAAHDSKWTLATIIGCLQSATGSFGLTYLLGERILRPIAAKALSASEFHGRFAPSVFVRIRLSWWIGTLAPAIGIIALCGMALWKPDDLTSTRDLALTVLLIVSTTLVASYGLALLTAGQLADPVRQLRSAITDVAQGDFDARVDVYDGSELGVLQAGFNRMMQVGEERRQLRELFGKHVGSDVATQALQLGTNLGGENRYVAVFFVDMIGSTTMAADRDPEEVLTILNDFFRIVVEVVDSRGGFVNKFVGDEALAVFGAPLHRPDATTACLGAARELRQRLTDDFPHPFKFAIGVSAGLAVAGNVGAPERYEYSVIGDPVNEASRLTELAKHRPSRLLASTNALYFADPDEQKHWDHGDSVLLRGPHPGDTPSVACGNLKELASPRRYCGARAPSDDRDRDRLGDTPPEPGGVDPCADDDAITAPQPVIKRRGKYWWIRWAVLVVLAIVLAVEIGFVSDQLAAAWRSLKTANPWWVLAAVAAAMASMHSFAQIQRTLLRSAGVKIRQWRSEAAFYAGNALSTTLPGGPVLSATFIYRQQRLWGATPVVASWQLVMSGVLQAVGLAILGLGGAFLLGAKTNPFSLIFSIGGLLAILVLAQAVASRPEMLDGIGVRILRWVNDLRGKPPMMGVARWREILKQMEAVTLTRRALGEAFGWSLFNWVADVACLAFAAYAVGSRPSLVGVMVAYAAARAAGSLPLMPGGLLVVEAFLVPGLVSSGMTLPDAISAMLIYRAVSWIFISAIGWVIFFFLFRGESQIDPDATASTTEVPDAQPPPDTPSKNSSDPPK